MHLIVQFLFWLQKWRYGKVLTTSRVWAKSPWVYLGVSTLYGALDRRSSPLDPKLRILITSYVSKLNACSFCISLNTEIALKRGQEKDKVFQLEKPDESPLFSDKEKAVLAYVKAITNLKVTLKERQEIGKYFSEQQIVEIVALAAYQNMTTRFNLARVCEEDLPQT